MEKNRKCSLSLKGRLEEPGIPDLTKGSIRCRNTITAHNNPTSLPATHLIKKQIKDALQQNQNRIQETSRTEQERPRHLTQPRNVKRTGSSGQTCSFPGQESWGRDYPFCFSNQRAWLCGEIHTVAILQMLSSLCYHALRLAL